MIGSVCVVWHNHFSVPPSGILNVIVYLCSSVSNSYACHMDCCRNQLSFLDEYFISLQALSHGHFIS